MLKNVLDFLKSALDEELKIGQSGTHYVNYIDISEDPPKFFKGKINMFLVNMEEETQLRSADRYLWVEEDGTKKRVSPPVRLNLIVMFTAKFTNYDTALQNLSKVIQFFQTNTVFDQKDYPELDERIPQLMVEFHPLNYNQQNEIWSALKRGILPSVCYKVKMVVIREEAGEVETEVDEIQVEMSQIH